VPAVVVDIATEHPSAALTRALLDACSASVREGKCELAPETAREPHLADATVTWEPSELAARIEVTGVRDDASALHARLLTFKDTDERIERWRAAGLTIATLVGDALPPASTAGSTGQFDDASRGAQQEQNDATKKIPPSGVPAGNAESVPSPKAPPNTVGDRADVLRGEARAASIRTRPLARTVWAGLSAFAGPGLTTGEWRFGAWADAAFRPTALPLFARLGLGYASRATDSRGLSVQWETLTFGVGAVVGSGSLRFEPHLSVGLENVHAAATAAATGKKDSGAQLGATLHLCLDGVWQLARLGLVARFEGSEAHAPTRITVEDRDVGTSAATNWGLGLGMRYYIE
jgi:hypothetical protein